MKFNLDSVLTCLRKNKYIFLVVFILFIFLFNFSHVREGLTGSVGDYDYLAPLPTNNSWSDATWKDFVTVHNTIYCPSGKGPDCIRNPIQPHVKDFFYKIATEPEAQYYIQNGKWPYNNYVATYASKHPLPGPGGKIANISDIQRHVPNRYYYGAIISPIESKIDPPPLSYQIFTGKAEPPVDISTLVPDLSFTKYSRLYPSDPVHPDNYFLINMK
jgi:hypothetical protein